MNLNDAAPGTYTVTFTTNLGLHTHSYTINYEFVSCKAELTYPDIWTPYVSKLIYRMNEGVQYYDWDGTRSMSATYCGTTISTMTLVAQSSLNTDSASFGNFLIDQTTSLNQLEVNTDYGSSSYDDTQILVTREYTNGGGMRKIFQSIENSGLVKLYNCDRMAFTEPVDLLLADFSVEAGLDEVDYWAEVDAEVSKREAGCGIAYEIDSVYNGIASDAMSLVTDYSTQFTVDLTPDVRSITVHPVITQEGIWVFNMKAGMSAGTARKDFTITVNIYVPCDGAVTLYPTALPDPWVEYVVKGTEIEKPFLAFTSQYPYSCPITDYDWRHKKADGSYGTFDSNLVSMDARQASDTLSFKVFTNDNDFAHNGGSNLYEGAIFAGAQDTRVPEVSTPLNMYVFYNCRDVTIEVDPT
jgi:hypothetical protein